MGHINPVFINLHHHKIIFLAAFSEKGVERLVVNRERDKKLLE
jgi:hypothetical protein